MTSVKPIVKCLILTRVRLQQTAIAGQGTLVWRSQKMVLLAGDLQMDLNGKCRSEIFRNRIGYMVLEIRMN